RCWQQRMLDRNGFVCQPTSCPLQGERCPQRKQDDELSHKPAVGDTRRGGYAMPNSRGHPQRNENDKVNKLEEENATDQPRPSQARPKQCDATRQKEPVAQDADRRHRVERWIEVSQLG